MNTTDLDGNSALHHAVESCDVEVINILLDCGRINIDIQNKVFLFFQICHYKCCIPSVIIKFFRKNISCVYLDKLYEQSKASILF